MKENVKLIPQETFVLMGYCKSQMHYEWIKKQGQYNFRMGSDRGALVLDPKAVSARYLLLHSEEEDICELWKITSEGPKVYAKTDLESSGYPNPKHANYLIFDVVKSENEVFTNRNWNLAVLKEKWPKTKLGYPKAISLNELMNAER